MTYCNFFCVMFTFYCSRPKSQKLQIESDSCFLAVIENVLIIFKNMA